MRAQGFVAAQDRFFEMDVRRHVTAGRLSELFGEDGLETDKYIRTMGWRRVAEEEWALLDPETRDALSAYAEGVNAYLEQNGPTRARGRVHDPRPDRPRLRAGAVGARRLAGLAQGDGVGPARQHGRRDRAGAGQPRPHARGDRRALPGVRHRGAPADRRHRAGSWTACSSRTPPATPPATRAARRTTPTPSRPWPSCRRAWTGCPELLGRGDGIGSNSWVVDGEHSSTGQPLLANDPHLGISQPGIWMQMGLHCREITADCTLDVSGFTFSGVPGVIIGHNADIAWGFTNLGPDVTDLYLERIEGDELDPGRRGQAARRCAPRRSRSATARTSPCTSARPRTGRSSATSPRS